MANASVCLSDFWSVFNNQAGISSIENPEVGVSYDHNFQLWQTGVTAIGFVLPTNSGNFALMSKRYGYNAYAEQNTGISYSRSLGKYFSASVTFNYLFYAQAEVAKNKGAMFFQTGLICTPIEKLQIGALFYNPGMVKLRDYNDKKVPTIIRFGLAYSFTHEVLFVLETEKELEYQPRFKTGFQYQIIPDFFIRTGFVTNPNQFSLGLGYKIKKLTTDIAITTHETLQISSQISFKYQF